MNQSKIPPPSWVLIKYRILRFLNILSSGFKGKKNTKTRTATAGKFYQGWLVAALLGFFIILSAGSQSLTGVTKIFDVLGNQGGVFFRDYPAWDCDSLTNRDKKSADQCRPIRFADGFNVPVQVSRALTIEFALLFLAMLCMNIASKELAAPEWDLEWLYSMPLPFRALIGSRILERTIVNPTALALVWPFTAVLCWKVELGYWSLLAGGFVFVIMSFFAATLKTVVDTGLRLLLAPARLRNLQAVLSIVALVAMLSAMSPVVGSRSFVIEWGLIDQKWTEWTPFGLITKTLTVSDMDQLWWPAGWLLLQATALYLASYLVLARLLRHGIVTGGERNSVRRSSKRELSTTAASASSFKKRFFTAVQRKELALLLRDRNFLVQTTVLPALIIGLQYFAQSPSQRQDWFAGNYPRLAATAFGVAAYSLIFSAFRVLGSEGKGLWLLYTFPKSLEKIIGEKVLLWLALAMIYPAALFGSNIWLVGLPGLEGSALFILAILGVLIYAVVAGCLGVLASKPLEDDPRQKSRADITYLYMILAGFYSYALFAESYWSKMALVILTALMALALWQKARDHLPYLLDPTATPPSFVSLADGLIAAMMFFVVQGISALIFTSYQGKFEYRELTICFAIAGSLTFISLRTIFWWKKTANVPKFFTASLVKNSWPGLLLGIATGGIALIYVFNIKRFSLFSEDLAKIPELTADTSWWLIALMVVAAPLFEEFIFRGMIFGGLRRSNGILTSALASAAIFAIVHPPVSFLPVFCLGVAAASGYALTGALITPILTHAVYNSIVLMQNQWQEFF